MLVVGLILLSIAVLAIGCLTIDFIKKKVAEKRKIRAANEVTSVLQTSEVFSEAVKKRITETTPITFDELDLFCEEKPFLFGNFNNDTGSPSEESFEAVKPKEIDEAVINLMDSHKGCVIIE